MRVASAKLKMLETDPGLQAWFDSAAGYAILPRVGKGGIGIGGARGTGIVVSGDQTLAEVTMTQVTVGFQLGGQVYVQAIFFESDADLDDNMVYHDEHEAYVVCGIAKGTHVCHEIPTRMSWRARSIAKARVMLTTPPFEAQ